MKLCCSLSSSVMSGQEQFLWSLGTSGLPRGIRRKQREGPLPSASGLWAPSPRPRFQLCDPLSPRARRALSSTLLWYVSHLLRCRHKTDEQATQRLE